MLILAPFATLAVTGVAALTVKIERIAQRLEGLKRSFVRLGGGGSAPQITPQRADNGWLAAVVRSFDD